MYDANGNVQWQKDADGYIQYASYDAATGGLFKTIADVNTADTSDFSGLPSGWSTPAGGGMELVTAYTLDNQGRPTEQTTPAGRVTYWTYDDVNHVTRTYAGWVQTGSNYGPTGPVHVAWDDWADGYAVALTAAYTPTTSAMPVDAASYAAPLGLVVDQTDDAGQVTAQDAYDSLSA